MASNNITSFKSGRFAGRSFDEIINENGEAMNFLKNSKNISYKILN